MTHRARFTQIALEQLGRPVLWAQRGPDVFDCSGLVAWSLAQVGAPATLRADHNAQRFFNESRRITEAEAIPGDLLFYGHSAEAISHVAIVVKSGMALSADGATSHITKLEVALANPANRVRLHDRLRFRPDEPFFALGRNHWADDLDKISL